MRIPTQPSKSKRKRKEIGADADNAPAGGRALQRILQQLAARGLVELDISGLKLKEIDEAIDDPDGLILKVSRKKQEPMTSKPKKKERDAPRKKSSAASKSSKAKKATTERSRAKKPTAHR